MRQIKAGSRERYSSLTIAICFVLVLISLIGTRVLKVDIQSIEHVDRNLYTVITNKENVNITTDDVLRIERTFRKAPLSNNNIEINKIYTDKGFIYISSNEPFYPTVRELVNAVDYHGLTTWEKEDFETKSLNKYSYMIGTPEKRIPIIFFLLSLRYISLSVGALALTILIFPLRLNEEEEESSLLSTSQQDQEYNNEDSSITVAK